MPNRNIRRAGVAVFALAAVILAATPAEAHVTVSSAQAVQGGYAKLTFRVPTESDKASTTKLEVVLPAGAPLKSVSLKLVAAAGPAAVQSAAPAPAPALPNRSGVSVWEIASLVIAFGALAVAVLAWRRRPTPA